MNKFAAILVLATFLYNGINAATNMELNDVTRQDAIDIYTNKTIRLDKDESSLPDYTVRYYLVTKENADVVIELDPEHPEIDNSNASFAVLIHGWLQNRRTSWYKGLGDSLQTRGEYYIIEVDWEEAAQQNYSVAALATKQIGTKVGNFITKLSQNSDIPMDNFMVVGFALGAHVAGFAGKQVKQVANEALPRIVGMDPAGPIFDLVDGQYKLNHTDAKVVQVIHTDGGRYGYLDRIGTIDFFPNGGTHQPGCLDYDQNTVNGADSKGLFCSHRSAYVYYSEAVRRPQDFVALKCLDYAAFLFNKCFGVKVSMGDLESNVLGNFYSKVNVKQTGDDFPQQRQKRQM